MQVENISVNDLINVKVNAIEYGSLFQRDGVLMMRIYPAGYIINSQVLKRVVNTGDVFALCMVTGKFYALSGNNSVIPVKQSKVTYQI